MKIVTWNINGVRSAQKGFHLNELVDLYDPDIIALQEIKMNETLACEYGYEAYYNFAEKKGYSGVVVLSKKKPRKVEKNFGLERFDEEGRFLMLEYEDFVLLDIYIPHGGRAKENHPYKFATIDRLIETVGKLDKDVFICTDFNVAHTERDVKNYKTNRNNNMFTEAEREKIDELLSCGLVDTFRVLHDEDGVYSMWPNGNEARTRNVEWRIDYIFASESLARKIKSCEYATYHMGSDHCPYILEIEMKGERKWKN